MQSRKEIHNRNGELVKKNGIEGKTGTLLIRNLLLTTSIGILCIVASGKRCNKLATFLRTNPERHKIRTLRRDCKEKKQAMEKKSKTMGKEEEIHIVPQL